MLRVGGMVTGGRIQNICICIMLHSTFTQQHPNKKHKVNLPDLTPLNSCAGMFPFYIRSTFTYTHTHTEQTWLRALDVYLRAKENSVKKGIYMIWFRRV